MTIRPDAVETKPDQLTLHSLDKDVGLVASTLGTDPRTIYALEKILPLTVTRDPDMIGRGTVSVRKDGNSTVAELKLNDPTADTPEEIFARTEEITHWIHLALNPEIARQIAEKQKPEIGLRGYDPEATLLHQAGLAEMSRQALDSYCQTLGIVIPRPPQTPEEAKAALALGIDTDKITFSQALKLHKQLSLRAQELGLFLSDDAAVAEWQKTYEYCSREVDEIDYSKDYEQAKFEYGWYAERQDSAKRKLTNEVKYAIQAAVEGGKDTGELVQLASSAGINLDSLGYKTQVVEAVIETMPPSQLLKSALKFVKSKDASPQALVNFAFIGNSVVSPYVRLVAKEPTPAEVESIRQEIVADLESLDPLHLGAHQITKLKDTLKDQFHKKLRGAVAKAKFASDAMLFFDDLPPEGTPERRSLLNNPEFMAEYRNAILDPENSPLAALSIDPEKFATNPDYAQRVAVEAAQKAFGRPANMDLSHFTANEQETLDYFINHGPLPDRIEVQHAEHLERAAMRQPVAGSKAEIEELALAEGAAQRRPELQMGADILLEPIGKAVGHKISGAEIRYPSIMNMWRVYSPLLVDNPKDPDNPLKTWHTRLEKFIDRIKKSGNWATLTSYFQASSLEEQQQVVASVMV